jgi:plastocyanin
MTRRGSRRLLACPPIARAVLACAGLAAALVLAACGSGSSTTTAAQPTASTGSATADTIVIRNFAFDPGTLTVPPGATVTVHNEDTTTHTLTDKADQALFSTGDVAPGQTKTFKAPTKAGSYPYICLIHQFMAGTLVVS